MHVIYEIVTKNYNMKIEKNLKKIQKYYRKIL